MSPDFALPLLKRMVEIPSLPGQESRLAGYLTEAMTEHGYRVGLDGAGNVVGDFEAGAGPLIMLIGHMDTVPGAIPVRLDGNQLYGRGTVDAKGPLATFICAAKRARDSGLKGRVVVVGAVEEETPGSRGAKYLLDRFQPSAVIIGEPSGWANVVLGYKGKIGIHYSVTRPPAHDAGAGDNASNLAVRFWNRVEGYLAGSSAETRLFHRPTATLRRLEGNPQAACLHISCRTPVGFDTENFLRFLEEIRDDGELQVDETTPPVLVDRADPTVRALIGAIRRRGGTPGLRVKTGTSDMNTVSVRWPVPMCAYGPGDSSLDHTPDEHIDLDEYLRAIDVLSDALATLAGDLNGLTQAGSPGQPPAERASGQPPAERASDQPPAERASDQTRAEGASDQPPADADSAYSPEEEEEITKRLQALGYLE